MICTDRASIDGVEWGKQPADLPVGLINRSMPMPKGAICSLYIYPDPPDPPDLLIFKFHSPFEAMGLQKGIFHEFLAVRKWEKSPFEGPIASERERNFKILRGRIKI